MSVEAFSKLLERCDVSPNGKRWFPVWVGRYANHQKKSRSVRLAVDRDSVIAFLRSLRDRGNQRGQESLIWTRLSWTQQ